MFQLGIIDLLIIAVVILFVFFPVAQRRLGASIVSFKSNFLQGWDEGKKGKVKAEKVDD